MVGATAKITVKSLANKKSCSYSLLQLNTHLLLSLFFLEALPVLLFNDTSSTDTFFTRSFLTALFMTSEGTGTQNTREPTHI